MESNFSSEIEKTFVCCTESAIKGWLFKLKGCVPMGLQVCTCYTKVLSVRILFQSTEV